MFQLETDHLCYQYPEQNTPALHDITIAIESGQFVAVIGANNSGKSTLCYALSGVIPHLFSGTMGGCVLINGSNSKDKSVGDIALDVGLILQSPTSQLSGIRYTVFEEIAFGLENRGVPEEEIQKRVEKVLPLLGLEQLATHSPFHLSGGQQQRLALATVLAVDPSIIILDEPTTFLDPQGAQLVFHILQQLKQQGKTIVIAEQRLDLIAEYADRVLAFDRGHLVLDGSPREVLTSPCIQQIKLKPTRYTQVAELTEQAGIWPATMPLTASLTETVAGLSRIRRSHAHPSS